MKSVICALLLSPLIVNAQISEAICGTWDNVMKQQTLGFREMGIPVGTAQGTYDSENDARTRIFLKQVVRLIYSDPKTGKIYLQSGKFLKDCIKTHRGY